MTNRQRRAPGLKAEQPRNHVGEARMTASQRRRASPAGAATLILGVLAIGLGVPATSSATASPPECVANTALSSDAGVWNGSFAPAVSQRAFPLMSLGDTSGFTGNGNCVWTVPAGVRSVDVVVVGGGGSGGGGTLTGGAGGGGGGGQVVVSTGVPVTSGGTVAISLGAGGVEVAAGANGNPGSATTFGSISASGGTGGRGGSGGSAGAGGASSTRTGGTETTLDGGGGAGSAANGANATGPSSARAGNGGAGTFANTGLFALSINPAAAAPSEEIYTYGGGGGGGSASGISSFGTGGSGRGGNGGGSGTSGPGYDDNSYGGGGGGGGTASLAGAGDTSWIRAGARGGGGQVIVRWLITKPGAPTGVTATPGNGTVSLAFTPPTDDGGSDITYYQYRIAAPAELDDGWETLSPATTGSPMTITGLKSGTAYAFLIRAVNRALIAGGKGDPSSETALVTPTAGGGSSGGGSAPAPTASATPTPTPTPTPTATTSVATLLGPVTNTANSGVPAGGVAPGAGVLIVNGEKVPVTVRPDAKDDKLLEVSGPGFTMSLAGLNAQGKPLGLTPDGALILEQDRTAAVAGTGFQPNSLVYLYLFSEPRFLGTVQTDANGSFKGQVPLPADIADGRHTLQSNGFTPDGTVRSLSLGVVVATPVVAAPKRASARVYFDPMSSVLTGDGMAMLKALVKKTGKKAVRTVSIGYVQGTTITANDEALSTQRAPNVATYLRKLGLKGRFVVRGDGIAKETGATARRVDVSVTYLRCPRGCSRPGPSGTAAANLSCDEEE